MPDEVVKVLNVSWDAFISYASEDKETVARPLAQILMDAGLHVWLDENELTIGDSLRKKINKGLADSRFGIVIISSAFLGKDWPEQELDALSAIESSRGEKVILPVWHNVDHASVVRSSPLLAGRLAANTSRGLESVAVDILRVVSPDCRSRRVTSDNVLVRGPTLFDGDLVGCEVASYTLQERLGLGGSGVVYKALQRATGRPVAIKLFYPLRPSLRRFIALLEKAVRSIAAIKHPNIITVYDSGSVRLEGNDIYYVSMEFVNGLNLRWWSRELRDAPDGFDRRKKIALMLVGAVRAAHQTIFYDEFGFQVRGICHGDIKPENVLVSSEGEPKLVDFLFVDFQRLLDPRTLPTSLSTIEGASTRFVGTPDYMAPEQESLGRTSPEADVYSLGKTFEVLFHPFPEQRKYDYSPFRRRLRKERAVETFDSYLEPQREVDRIIKAMTSDLQENRPSLAWVSGRLKAIDKRSG